MPRFRPRTSGAPAPARHHVSVTRIWYCRNCGYEVTARGRCHLCRERLTASDLPELEASDDQEEVGYRLDDWADEDRGYLISELNEMGVVHRFEDDELVVDAGDEERVDDLLKSITEGAASAGAGEVASGVSAGGGGEVGEGNGDVDGALQSAVGLLADAARRLQADPTDMHADGDVAEASTAVFAADGYPGFDDETWAAVGRVTRRLLAVLGADEALEDEIRRDAGILHRLLAPAGAGGGVPGRVAAGGRFAAVHRRHGGR